MENPGKEQVRVTKPCARFGPRAQHENDDLHQQPWGLVHSACPPVLAGVQHPLVCGMSFIHLFLFFCLGLIRGELVSSANVFEHG